MAMTASRAFQAPTRFCSSVAQIEAALAPECRSDFRRLVHVLQPPLDAPGAINVLSRAIGFVAAYRKHLGDRVSEILETEVASRLNNLSAGMASVTALPAAADALHRRLSRHPAWAVLLHHGPDKLPEAVAVGIGAELASALRESRRFSPALATHVRRAMESGEAIDAKSISAKKLENAIRNANALFVSRATRGSLSSDAYAKELRSWCRAQSTLASDRRHQAVLHHRTQSRLQLLRSAVALRQAVEHGDNMAIHICVGSLFHLRPDLVHHITILSAHSDDSWLVALDPVTGCLHFDLRLVANGCASPPSDAARDALIAASRVLVTPLPEFLAARLLHLIGENPAATTLGELAPVSEPLSEITSTLEQSANIRPTFARFRNSLGPFAVSLGVDRYIASQICHTAGLTPAGKHFYAVATRLEIWDASDRLFDALGWGDAVPIIDGLASGSQVVASEATISKWLVWMSNELELKRLSAAESHETLLEFHNIYAKVVASQISLVLALRERKPIAVTAQLALSATDSIRLVDKACGLVPGPHRIPLPPTVISIFQGYFNHLRGVDQRLARLGMDPHYKVRRALQRILAGDNVPLFCIIAGSSHEPLSSDALTKWWPSHFGLLANCGRHFIQNALRRSGARSSDIDWYVRHSLRGVAPSSTASTQPSSEASARLTRLLCEIAERVGLSPLPGISHPGGHRK